MTKEPGNAANTSGVVSGANDLERIYDYAVLDRSGTRIGTVCNLWPNYAGNGLTFLGIKTDLLAECERVVPADDAVLNHEKREIRLPLSAESIKSAPDFNVTGDILDDDSDRIRQYYGYNAAFATNPIVTGSAEGPAVGSTPGASTVGGPTEASATENKQTQGTQHQSAQVGRSARYRRLQRRGSADPVEHPERSETDEARRFALLDRPLDPTLDRTNPLRD